ITGQTRFMATAKQGPKAHDEEIHPAVSARSPLHFKFWGVRGSIPTPGPTTVRYGGNTSCVEVRAEGEIIILDGGTGLRPLGHELIREFDRKPLKLTMLLTHRSEEQTPEL